MLTTNRDQALHGLRWVDLATADPAAARSFYCRLFGWSAEERRAGGGALTTFARSGTPIGSLYQLGARQIRQGVPSHWTAYVAVPDADAAALKAADLGGDVIVPPQDIAGFARISLIRDPAGALIGLWQEPPASTSGKDLPTTGRRAPP